MNYLGGNMTGTGKIGIPKQDISSLEFSDT